MTSAQLPENSPANTKLNQDDTGRSQKRASSKKKLKITLIVTAILLVLLVIIGANSSIVPKYSVNDLVKVTNGNIQFSRPVSWQDASFADNLKKDFGLNVANASIFGDKVIKDKNGNYSVAGAFVMFGQASSDTTDVAIIKTPEFRSAFEESMNKTLQQDNFKSSTCAAISNYGKNYNYDFNNFPVSVAIKLNCQLSDAEKKKFKAESVEMRIAIVIANDGKTYTYTLAASDKSWAKNEAVYFQMLTDFKALK